MIERITANVCTLRCHSCSSLSNDSFFSLVTSDGSLYLCSLFPSQKTKKKYWWCLHHLKHKNGKWRFSAVYHGGAIHHQRQLTQGFPLWHRCRASHGSPRALPRQPDRLRPVPKCDRDRDPQQPEDATAFIGNHWDQGTWPCRRYFIILGAYTSILYMIQYMFKLFQVKKS